MENIVKNITKINNNQTNATDIVKNFAVIKSANIKSFHWTLTSGISSLKVARITLTVEWSIGVLTLWVVGTLVYGGTITFIDISIAGTTSPTIETITDTGDSVTRSGVGCNTAAGLCTIVTPITFRTFWK